MNKTLVFAVFDFDRFSKHDQIGEVQLPLSHVDLANVIDETRELVSVESDAEQVRKGRNRTASATSVRTEQNGRENRVTGLIKLPDRPDGFCSRCLTDATPCDLNHTLYRKSGQVQGQLRTLPQFSRDANG